eukprot:scaffold9916_cov100-Skeletonema_dohrnii-CCMP3373.AAC.4
MMMEQPATNPPKRRTNPPPMKQPTMMPLAAKQTNLELKRQLKSDDSKPSPKKAKPSPPTAIAVRQTTPAMTFALEAIAPKLSDQLTSVQRLNLAFPEWLRYKLFRSEGAESALDIYLSHTNKYVKLLALLGEGGTSVWRSLFLAEYPYYNGVQLLTEKTEEYGENGFSSRKEVGSKQRQG